MLQVESAFKEVFKRVEFEQGNEISNGRRISFITYLKEGLKHGAKQTQKKNDGANQSKKKKQEKRKRRASDNEEGGEESQFTKPQPMIKKRKETKTHYNGTKYSLQTGLTMPA